ncbi:MAG: sigma-54 interaction domain-containing protein, partial [Kiritimatiellia bacterium]
LNNPGWLIPREEPAIMPQMLLPTENQTGNTYFVLKNYLPQLIQQRKILRFRRSNGWFDVDADSRKVENPGYRGPERRVSRTIDWSLLPLPVEEQLHRGCPIEAILGYGRRAREVSLQLKNVAKTNLSVLIQGKTGTGKGVAALILHELSNRRDKPFIKVDCGAIPPSLIESELFGYEKGSFTGAYMSKPGRFQLANGGTIFLDEISNLSMEMQTRLLGFLEERVVSSIGGLKSVKLDVRIISATNADLLTRLKRYEFREDLYYRLNEFEIVMPPLKERPDDLFYLATKFLTMANVELEKNIYGFSERAIDFFSGYEWSGNIRELKNAIRRAALLANEVIDVEHLTGEAWEGSPYVSLDSFLENAFVKGYSLPEITEMIRQIAEKRIIQRVYERSQGNKRRTCESLGIDYSTLFRKMKEYGIH